MELNDEKAIPSEPVASEKEVSETMKAEMQEIEKYKWYLGERIGHDPLLDRSMNDICKEWIIQNARAFRENWEQNKRKQCS